MRIAAVGDIHCRKDAAGTIAPHLAPVNDLAEVLLLCGDLTDYGLAEEAHVLAKELSVVRIPMIAVLGNHDWESGAHEEVAHILREGGVQVLDGDACEVRDVGFAGIKGFIGGFGRATLGHWGEPVVKRFVQEAIDEALKLESALSRLRTGRRVAMMHYAPIQETVMGEPTEIVAFLGNSRLAEPLGRYPVDAVFHGHAHHGTPEARSPTGIPVFNVAMPLMKRAFPDSPPFRVLDLDAM